MMLLLLAGLAAGLLSLVLLPALPSPWIPLLLSFLLLPWCWRRPWLCLPMAFGAGMAWALWQAGQAMEARLPVAWEGQPLVVAGHVVGLPEPAANETWRFRFQPQQLWQDEGGAMADGPWRRGLWQLSLRGEELPRPGEHWRLTVRMKRPNGWSNPGGFDYEAWLLQEGVTATGYAQSALRLSPAMGWEGRLDRFRLSVRERFVAAFGDSPPAGVLLALLTGDRVLVTDAAWERYAATGITHLMAISGLHISLVALVVAWLCRQTLGRVAPVLALRWPLQQLSLAAGGLAALVYCLLAGMSVPTQRTLIMLVVVIAGLWWRREWGPWQTLLLALVAVLLWQPLAAHAVGLWLSFGAVALLMLLAWPRPNEPGWRAFGRAQWIMTLGLLPLSLLVFSRLSWVSPLANVLAIPLVTFVVVPLGMVGLLLTGVWEPAGILLWQVAVWLITALDWLLGQMAAWPWAFRHWSLPPWGGFWLALFIALLLMPGGLPGRALAPFFLLPVLWGRELLPEGGWRFTLLDVGQGLSAVIETRRHVLVYDTGPAYSPRFETGGRVVLPYLRWRGIDRIDVLMLSHDDLDHTGGAPAVLAGMAVGGLYGVWPKEIRRTGAAARPVIPCRAGDGWVWDGVRFDILFPQEGIVLPGTNNQSCVLRVSTQEFSVLLPGDLERGGEWVLLEAASQLPADVLVLGHHGSQSSSSDAFLDAVAPREALVSAGYRNRFRHPSPKVLTRLQARHIPWHETAASGAIRYTVLPGGAAPEAEGWREESPRYWRVRPAP